MQIELLTQTHRECFDEFRLTSAKNNWDMLIMVLDGECAITFKDTQKTVTVGKNEIALMPAGIEFERTVTRTLTCYNMEFLSEPEHPFYLATSPGKLSLPAEQNAAIFESMKRAFILADNRELITHILTHILAENYLFGIKNKNKAKPLSKEIVSATRYMRKNFNKKIDIDELAKQVFLSHSGLIWKFRQELGTTPSSYLSMLRLQNAKSFLLNYPYSITQISEMCGYSNPYYFTNAFRRYSGMSPTEFRKHYLKRT
ncbi:MAG: helix-turn-helix transcriptional regulator [Ruminococcaceae bacterium]|nr:helix-turn-helix transcriptional regulator [Oscillospiraceae bacterium]